MENSKVFAVSYQIHHKRLLKPHSHVFPVQIEEVKTIIEQTLGKRHNTLCDPYNKSYYDFRKPTQVKLQKEKKPKILTTHHFYPKFSDDTHNAKYMYRGLKVRCPTPILKNRKTRAKRENTQPNAYIITVQRSFTPVLNRISIGHITQSPEKLSDSSSISEIQTFNGQTRYNNL